MPGLTLTKPAGYCRNTLQLPSSRQTLEKCNRLNSIRLFFGIENASAFAQGYFHPKEIFLVSTLRRRAEITAVLDFGMLFAGIASAAALAMNFDTLTNAKELRI
jgi:hypothetical protein